jgi:hypothetical protein
MSGDGEPSSEIDETLLEERWQQFSRWFVERFGREATIEAVLFMIGIQSRGRGFEPALGRDVKQDVIMEGTYCAFETIGLYRRVGAEADGSWIWERTAPLPALSVEEQERLLRVAILAYFQEQGLPAPPQQGS